MDGIIERPVYCNHGVARAVDGGCRAAHPSAVGAPREESKRACVDGAAEPLPAVTGLVAFITYFTIGIVETEIGGSGVRRRLC